MCKTFSVVGVACCHRGDLFLYVGDIKVFFDSFLVSALSAVMLSGSVCKSELLSITTSDAQVNLPDEAHEKMTDHVAADWF